MLEDFLNENEGRRPDRRSLARVAPASRMWAAVENETRREMLGMAEVADFSGLGLALAGISGDPVAALGDKFWLTLVAEEGIIPLGATLVHIDGRQNRFGLKLETPSGPGQHFLLRVYERAARAVPTA
ncbi:MAG: hypothetical protein M3416_04765 [Acidobacteriota bacterium]|nr:hypothetical protein [Acidobacteriota bacterium]